MPTSKLAKKKTIASTQQYIDIAEIRDDVVVLKDGSLRTVLLVSSINFALKSEDEQNAIVQGYITFLNSLDFSFQIVIQSRKLNIDKYLEDLEQKQREQTNELLRTQIGEYREFVSQLVTLGEIMGKRFYVIVPYAHGKDIKRGFFSSLSMVLSPAKVVGLSEQLFAKYHDRLIGRTEKVISGFGALGLTAVQLNTQSLVELYYQSYNPDVSYFQKLPTRDRLRPEALEKVS